MAVSPQVALPVTITDADPNIPGSGTAADAASIMPNLEALKDAHNTHGHTDLANASDLNAHTQLTTGAHGGIVAASDARVNSFYNTSRIVSSYSANHYVGHTGATLTNLAANTLRAARVVMPFTGTLFDLSIFVGTASGNIIAGIYSTAATRVSQFNTGSIALAGTNAWQILAFNSTLSTSVSGNQTVGTGSNLNVASTTGFSNTGSIVVSGNTYAYTAKGATTFTLSAGGTFVGGSTVTQAGLAVAAGTHYDLALMMDNATATIMTRTLQAGTAQLPTTNFLVVGAAPKLTWSYAPGSFTWQANVTEANASNTNTTLPLILARVA